MSKEGYAPTATRDTARVLPLIEKEKPHLILLDLMSPGSDVVELMKTIRSITNAPVILVSEYGEAGHIAKSVTMGAAD